MSTGSRASERSTRLPSHARGRLFWLALIGVWPVLIVAAIVGWSVVGGELAFWIASACSAAFCVDVLLPQILFEVDDGDAGPPSFEELG